MKIYNAKHGIRWRYNLPKAPWWGGMFERIVRSVKRCLKKTLGKGRLTYEELLTVLTEVEAVINNRPLSYLEENDVAQPLTPSHLFCGRRLFDRPKTCASEPIEMVGEHVRKRVKLLNTMMDHFWNRWKNEYLVELRENHKMRTRQKKLDIKIGDVVLIHDDNKKRNEWKIGRIERLILGNDEVIRGAVLCTSGTSRISRPIQKLYPLEISERDQSYSEKHQVKDTCGKEKDEFDQDVRCQDINGTCEDGIDTGDDKDNSRDRSINEQNDDDHLNIEKECSGSLGPPGDAPGGNTDIKGHKNSEQLLSDSTKLRSKRRAAIEGQLQRRLKEIKGN